MPDQTFEHEQDVDLDVPVLEALHVSKSFGDVPVLDDVSLSVHRREVLVVRGANGTGKSTLLRCLTGWDRFDAGEVLFHGDPWDPESSEFRAGVAVGLGGDDQFLGLTVREHLEFVARAHGNSQPDGVVTAALDEMALARVADRFPFALSQGQRRRLGLAACWVRPRQLLVLDEPEQNLDVRGRAWLADRILAERADGVAIIVVCHDDALTDRIADLVLELEFLDDEPGGQSCGDS